MRGSWIVFVKEMRETLRDRRTLVMMIVIPVLLYPVLLVVAEQLALFGMRQLEREPARVGLVGEPPPDLRTFLEADTTVRLVDVGDPEQALRADRVSAVAQVSSDGTGEEGTRTVTVLYDGADDRSQRGRNVLENALRSWGDTLLARRLVREGLPGTFARPLAVADSSVARPEELGGYALGRFLPMLLVVITLLGAFYPAIDLAAGEKERGTLETLLTAPVPPGQIVTGKFATVATIGVVAAGLNLASMLLTFQTGLFQFGSALEIEFSLPLRTVLLIFATLVPLAVLFGALFLGIAVRSRSFKEAQNALTPVYMLVLVPALLPLFPGIGFTPLLALMPVAGVALFFRELMVGSAELLPGVLALGSTLVYAGVALAFAADAFGREDVLFGGEDAEETGEGGKAGWLERIRATLGGRSTGRALPTLGQAGGLVVVVAALFFYVGTRFQVGMGERGILLTEWALLFLPAVLFVVLGGFDARETLSLRKPSWRHLEGGLLLIVGGTPVAWLLAWLQSFVLEIPEELVQQMTQLVTADDPLRLLWLLFLIAVTPAFCEEVVFRGVLLAGSRRELSPGRLVALNAVVFGLFHVTFETAFRFIPTAWLGLLLAYAVWASRSIWIGVLMHVLNNGIIVLIAAFPQMMDIFADPEAPPPVWLLVPAFISLVAGWMILRRGSRVDEGEGPDEPKTSPEAIP